MAAFASASLAAAAFALLASAARDLDLVEGGVRRTVVIGTDARSASGVRSCRGSSVSVVFVSSSRSSCSSSSSVDDGFLDGVTEGVLISAGVNLGRPLRLAPLAIAAVAGLLAESFLTAFFLALT